MEGGGMSSIMKGIFRIVSIKVGIDCIPSLELLCLRQVLNSDRIANLLVEPHVNYEPGSDSAGGWQTNAHELTQLIRIQLER